MSAQLPEGCADTLVMLPILVVDDENEIRKMVRICLERLGHTVREAGDGEIAIEDFRQNGASIVITDLVMPRMGGLALIQALRKESSDVRIIALSAFPEELSAARRLGADWAESKPFSPSRIAEAVVQVAA